MTASLFLSRIYKFDTVVPAAFETAAKLLG